jgi:phenylalanine ammonia-lyase
MASTLNIGAERLSPQQILYGSAPGATVRLDPSARQRIRKGREELERLIAGGTRVYGVNTGVGGNIRFELTPEQSALLQANLMRHLSCATGSPLPTSVVRAAMLLRIATFATGCSAVREQLVDALIAMVNREVTPVVPRYGSVGASGDLMPSAYIARVLIGMGEAEYQGRRMNAREALAAAGVEPIEFAPKEGLALINGTTVMTAAAIHVWSGMRQVLRALLDAVAMSIEALEAPSEPYEPWVQDIKGHPGQSAVAEYVRGQLEGSIYSANSRFQAMYSLRCPPQGLGPVWEALEDGSAVLEREINSANDNPLIDPESGRLFLAGNFYGGHIARLLDGWKLDLANMANWANAVMAVLVDDRFNRGLPANLVPDPGLNSGFKGMQLSITSLACAVRQIAGPSLIHSLPTETYNQDVVSLGMHAAVTASDALDCLCNQVAMVLAAATQAVDLRGGPQSLGDGTSQVYKRVRQYVGFLDRDRPMESEIAALSESIRQSGVSQPPL